MKKQTKKNLMYLGGALALAGALYYFTRPKDQDTGTTTPALPPAGPAPTPYTPPAGPAPIDPTIRVGDTIKAAKLAPGFITEWTGTAYTAGGTDGKGNVEAGKYAGVVRAISSDGKAVKVDNYANAMKAANLNVYSFWLRRSDVTK